MLLPLLTVKLDYSTLNHSEFALAAFCVLERSESNREQPLSTLNKQTQLPYCDPLQEEDGKAALYTAC